MVDPEISARFSRYLLKSETVKWTGRPRAGVVFQTSDALLIPFSLVWCSFAIFWETVVVSTRIGGGFPAIVGAPFVLGGLFFVFGRFVVDALSRANTYYALTNGRALILRTWGGGELIAIDLRKIGQVTLRPAGDQRGTIMFGNEAIVTTRSALSWTRYKVPPSEFFQVRDVDAAYLMAQQSHA